MFKKIAFTAYKVLDMERARKFYEQTLGFKVCANYDEMWVEYDMPGGGCFALTTMGENWQPSSTAGGCVAFEVEDLDKLCAELKQKGVAFKLDIFSSPVCKMTLIIDSEGNVLMLHQLTNR